jgi:hypothetical protein
MKKTILTISVLWALLMTVIAVKASPNVDDVQARLYKDGWGVVISVPTLGGKPQISVFQIDPTPDQDMIRAAQFDTHVLWGAGPGGEPVVTVTQDDGR